MRGTLSTCEKTTENRTQVSGPQLLHKDGTVVGICFHVPPRRGELGVNLLQIVHHNWIVFLFTCLYGNTCFAMCGLSITCSLPLVTVHFVRVTPPHTQEYKLSDALNEVSYCVKLQSTSFLGSILPGLTAFRVVNSSLLLLLYN